jgi:hypothetical protein
MSHDVYQQLKALNIELPPVAVPAAAYLPFVQSGKLVFLSGHIAKQDGKAWVGQLGLTMNTEEGKAAARAVPLTCWARCTPPARPPAATSTTSSASSR